MKNKLVKALLLKALLASSSFASDGGSFGLTEEATSAARKTLVGISKVTDSAIRLVEKVIYPNLHTYNINTSSGTNILVDLIGSTTNTSPTLSTEALGYDSASFTSNPYIARAAIIESGLKIQIQITASGVANEGQSTTFNIPIFEPLLSKKIMLIPIFNVKYDSSGNITIKDQEISGWECLTNADDGISNSGVTIAPGMKSIVSMGAGALGTCQFLPSANWSGTNSIWQNI